MNFTALKSISITELPVQQNCLYVFAFYVLRPSGTCSIFQLQKSLGWIQQQFSLSAFATEPLPTSILHAAYYGFVKLMKSIVEPLASVRGSIKWPWVGHVLKHGLDSETGPIVLRLGLLQGIPIIHFSVSAVRRAVWLVWHFRWARKVCLGCFPVSATKIRFAQSTRYPQLRQFRRWGHCSTSFCAEWQNARTTRFQTKS